MLRDKQEPGPRPILELREVSKAFPGVQALDRVSVRVLEGEVHALLGENGAGKSTMVSLIAGVNSPDAGTIDLAGEPVTFSGPRDSLEKGVAVIYQELSLVPELSVAENIFLGRLPRGRFAAIDWTELRRRALEILERIGLDADPGTPVVNLSTGEQQQVEIARALSMNPKLLLMDEPTSALAEQEVRHLFDVIRKLRAEGLTVIFISHRLEEVWEITDRMTVLRDGKFVFTKATAEITQSQLAEAMVGRKLPISQSGKAETGLVGGGGGDTDATNAGTVVLAVRGLSNTALRNVDIEVGRGEIVGLAGALGSGRTELLRTIYGADSISSGHIFIEGTEAAIRSPANAINYGIYLVPEDRKQDGLVLNMSVADNMTLPYLDRLSSAGFISRRQRAEVADRFVTKLRIKTPGREQRVVYLSGGNQQKTILARWLSMRPRVLLLDQPTRGVDIGAKEEIYELVRELATSGVGILFVATELPELLRLCDRIYVLRNGGIAREFVASRCSEEDIFLAASGEGGA